MKVLKRISKKRMLERENHHRLKVVKASRFLKCTSEPCFEKSQLRVEMGGTYPLTGRVRPKCKLKLPCKLFGLIRVEPRVRRLCRNDRGVF